MLNKGTTGTIFKYSVLNKGTTGTIFRTSLVWRGPWLGIEPGTPALDASTIPLGYRGGGFCVSDLRVSDSSVWVIQECLSIIVWLIQECLCFLCEWFKSVCVLCEWFKSVCLLCEWFKSAWVLLCDWFKSVKSVYLLCEWFKKVWVIIRVIQEF